MSDEKSRKRWRLPSLQQFAGGAIGCAILALILLVFTYLLYVGYMYIETHG